MMVQAALHSIYRGPYVLGQQRFFIGYIYNSYNNTILYTNILIEVRL